MPAGQSKLMYYGCHIYLRGVNFSGKDGGVHGVDIIGY